MFFWVLFVIWDGEGVFFVDGFPVKFPVKQNENSEIKIMDVL